MLLPLILISVVWIAIAPASFADDLPAAQPDMPIEQLFPGRVSANDISSEKVSQFVQAYLQVLGLIERREGDLQAAETESESLQVQKEIEAEAFAAIEAAGLTPQEYLQLLGVANTDPEFGERIAAQLQEAMQ